MAKLILQGAEQQEFDIPEDKETLIGRSSSCDISYKNDDEISREHCAIRPSEGTFYVRDNDSTNGTLVNGKDIGKEKVPLEDGSTLAIGTTKFKFTISENE